MGTIFDLFFVELYEFTFLWWLSAQHLSSHRLCIPSVVSQLQVSILILVVHYPWWLQRILFESSFSLVWLSHSCKIMSGLLSTLRTISSNDAPITCWGILRISGGWCTCFCCHLTLFRLVMLTVVFRWSGGKVLKVPHRRLNKLKWWVASSELSPPLWVQLWIIRMSAVLIQELYLHLVSQV